VSRREQWQVDAQARELGEARELGAYRQGYQSVHHGVTQKGWGGFLIGLGLLAGIPFASQASGQARAVLFGVAGGLIALGAVLIKTAPREKADWIFLYAGGIAQVSEGQAPRVVPWNRLDHVTNEYSPGTEDCDPSLETTRVTGVDGTVITAEASRCNGIGQLDREIGRMVAAMRLPAAIEQYRNGTPVVFGGLSVSPDGIASAGSAGWTAWQDIRSIRVSPYLIELKTSAGTKDQRIGLDGVPDSCVAILLIQDLTSQLGIRQKGSPAAVSPPPRPAGELSTAAGAAILSEADVSTVLGWPMEAVPGLAGGGAAAQAFRGGGVTLSLTLRNEGTYSAIDRAAARRLGRALPGIGDEAWLIKGDHTIILRVSRSTVKLSLTDLPPSARADLLIPLAHIVAARLTASA
jgi:hypothetical protein